MTITLYGSHRSRAMRTLRVLAELALPFTHVPYDWVDPELSKDRFRALNPAGAIPTLVADSVAIAETLALALYLAQRPWLCTDHFTVGDLNVASVVSPSRLRSPPMTEAPPVADRLTRCYSQPAARATQERYG